MQSFFLFALIQKDGVDVAFKMIDGDKGEVLGVGQSFGVGNADEQCSGEARA